MLDWLVDNSILLYALLAAAGTTLFALWYNTPRKPYLAGLGTLAVLAGLLALLGLFVETDFGRIRRAVEVMADGARTRNLDATFAHISEVYRTPAGRDKAEFRQFAEQVLSRNEVTEVVVWGFESVRPITRHDTRATVSFEIKARGHLGEMFYRCEAVFEKDPALGWQVVSTRFFDPVRTNEELRPGF